MAVPQQLLRTAGRILSLRSYRSILFFDIHEDGRYIQCAIRQSPSPEAFAYFQTEVTRGNNVSNTMPSESVAWLQYLFEHAVEPLLIQPIFITEFASRSQPVGIQ